MRCRTLQREFESVVRGRQISTENPVSNGPVTDQGENLFNQLQREIQRYPTLAVAISGGVDSTTLASVAHTTLGNHALMLHAVSPAVPTDATERVKAHAQREGWKLTVLDAREFSDVKYRINPVNRCYYCKSNLYTRIGDVWSGVVASGANLDDLGDYRPGLSAAGEHDVVHPLIDAGIDKSGVRSLAAFLGLHDVAELPAQPCLSSRVETGIAIDPHDLVFVHRIESYLASALGQGDIRCRISHNGVRIEIANCLIEANANKWPDIKQTVESMILSDNRLIAGFSTYQKGSAFIHTGSKCS
ncbi:MAG: hypothetical protein KTR32_01770 [Granulosicoccus sp.]|nr:hypothetical protein [Granulosicoccus sp.]